MCRTGRKTLLNVNVNVLRFKFSVKGQKEVGATSNGDNFSRSAPKTLVRPLLVCRLTARILDVAGRKKRRCMMNGEWSLRHLAVARERF